MEGAADLEGQHPLGSRGFGQLPGPVHRGGVAGDDDLTGAVEVGALHHAGVGGLLTDLLQGIPVQVQHRRHAAGAVLHRVGHGLAPEGHQGDGGGGVQHPGAVQGGVLPQAEAGGIVGDDARLLQQGGDPGGEGHHAGLGVPGVIQAVLRSVKARLLQVEVHRRAVQHRTEGGVGLI